MKNKYTIMLIVALAGLGIGAYYMMKKRGVRMQSTNIESEQEIKPII